jgi:hypothetical protein
MQNKPRVTHKSALDCAERVPEILSDALLPPALNAQR